VAVAGQGAEGLDEGLLRRVVRVLSVAGDAVGRVIDAVLVGQDQAVEGLQVALAAALDESALRGIHGHPGLTGARFHRPPLCCHLRPRRVLHPPH